MALAAVLPVANRPSSVTRGGGGRKHRTRCSPLAGIAQMLTSVPSVCQF